MPERRRLHHDKEFHQEIMTGSAVKTNQNYGVIITPHQIFDKDSPCEGSILTLIKKDGENETWRTLGTNPCDNATCHSRFHFPLSEEELQELVSPAEETPLLT